MDRREDRVALELHRAVAEIARRDPERVREVGLRNLARMRERRQSPQSAGWLDEWESLLIGPVDALIEAMLAPGERAIDMRQVGPFVGLLDEPARLAAIARAARPPQIG